jgi:hypothetical protein
VLTLYPDLQFPAIAVNHFLYTDKITRPFPHCQDHRPPKFQAWHCPGSCPVLAEGELYREVRASTASDGHNAGHPAAKSFECSNLRKQMNY